MSELLPCPFCGCAMSVRSNRDWHRLIGDHDDDCVFIEEESMVVPAQDHHLKTMIADWNRRAPAQQPAAAPVSGDVALPELPSREIRDLVRSVYDKAYENGRADAIAKNCSRYIGRRVEDEQGDEVEAIARTYGQQCSDAALERVIAGLKEVQRYEESEMEGGGVYPDTNGAYVKLQDALSAIRALKGGE